MELASRMAVEYIIEFKVISSLDFLRTTPERFDLIFVDGNHSAAGVYYDIAYSLRCLAENGVILMHDYFPALRPLWEDGKVDPGPVLGISRLIREGAAIKPLPLGTLPWPTKENSHRTSLTVLTGMA